MSGTEPCVKQKIFSVFSTRAIATLSLAMTCGEGVRKSNYPFQHSHIQLNPFPDLIHINKLISGM
jgi:hypothetical protein